MALEKNMEAIQTVTVGSGGASSIGFTNIPQTYDDLLIVLSSRFNAAVNGSSQALFMKINTVLTNRTWRRLEAFDGNNRNTDNNNTGLVGLIQGNSTTTNAFSNIQVYFPNYKGSTNKSFSVDGVTVNNASTGSDIFLVAGLWSQTSAITEIELYNGSTTDTLRQYSSATLYGITRASKSAKATGGAIYQDADYFYHVFAASGTFTPTANITADYLVVAGGGGGGAKGGGGGAGGLRSTVGTTGGLGSLESALSLTNGTAYRDWETDRKSVV